jgi:hypothetical protein
MVNALRVLYPQEVEVFYLLPTLRRELALAFKDEGMSQKDIARILQVTEAAVSQYLSSKRAVEVSLPGKARKAVREAAHRIADGKRLVEEIQGLLRLLREDGTLCRVHQAVNGDLPKNCKTCFE